MATAYRFINPLDVSGLEVKNFTLEKRAAAPEVPPYVNYKYYDTTLNEERYWNGTVWVGDGVGVDQVAGLADALGGKVDKVEGKGLSDQNYTLSEKEKLAGLESSRFKGQYTSVAALEAAHPTAIVGAYANVDEGVDADVVRYVYDSNDEKWVRQLGVSTLMTAAQIKEEYESNPDTNAFTDDEKTKLAGIATGATANATDADLRDRTTHTGEQAISTITGLQAALDAKVATTNFTWENLQNKPDFDVLYAPKEHSHVEYLAAMDILSALATELQEVHNENVSIAHNVEHGIFYIIREKNPDIQWDEIQNIPESLTNIDTLLDGKVDKEVGKGLSDQNFTLEEKTKLATLENRANHTGEQAISTITGLQDALNALAKGSFTATIAIGDWVSAGGGYTYTVPAITHGLGETRFLVATLSDDNGVYVTNYQVSATGTVTVFSAVAIASYLVISA
jgi:hypothetical protein